MKIRPRMMCVCSACREQVPAAEVERACTGCGSAICACGAHMLVAASWPGDEADAVFERALRLVSEMRVIETTDDTPPQVQ